MKFSFLRALIKVPAIVIGIIVSCLVMLLVVTDPAPSTLPRRTGRLIADIVSLVAPTRKPVPSPPLVNIPVVTAQAASTDLRDEYFVIGVELNGESRAYALNVLSRPDHHVLNDTLGGQAIAVTWCGLCQSAVVFSREVEGKTITLFVSGEVRGENMVMQDIETGSTWPQMLGEATSGPLSGKVLEQIPSVFTDWKTWRTEHPDTTVPNISQTVDIYRHDSVSSGTKFEKRYFANIQWGLVRGERAVSWPLKELARASAVNDAFAGLPFLIIFDGHTATIAAFERRLDDKELTFRFGPGGLIDDQTASSWDPLTGRASRGVLAGRRLTPVPGVISHPRGVGDDAPQ